MSALIIRMPQEKRERLRQVAKERNLSVNKLIEEMATVAIAEHDAEVRFHVRAARRARPGQGGARPRSAAQGGGPAFAAAGLSAAHSPLPASSAATLARNSL